MNNQHIFGIEMGRGITEIKAAGGDGLTINRKRPANAIWREFSGGVNSDSLIAQKFQGVSNESTGRVIQ